jgi:hypothetical protein
MTYLVLIGLINSIELVIGNELFDNDFTSSFLSLSGQKTDHWSCFGKKCITPSPSYFSGFLKLNNPSLKVNNLDLIIKSVKYIIFQVNLFYF